MGSVFRALDTRSGLQVALKLLTALRLDRPDERRGDRHADGPGRFERCPTWLDDARRLEPLRGEIDVWHGWLTLNDPRSTPDEVLGHWRRAREKDPRMALRPIMRQLLSSRFPLHAGLAEFR